MEILFSSLKFEPMKNLDNTDGHLKVSELAQTSRGVITVLLYVPMSQSSWEITRRAHVQSELVVFHRHHTLVMDWLMVPVIMRGIYHHENIFFSRQID